MLFRVSLGTLFYHVISILSRENKLFFLGKIKFPWENVVHKLAFNVLLKLDSLEHLDRVSSLSNSSSNQHLFQSHRNGPTSKEDDMERL